ncbi:hypothetical protein [Salipaludibacillus sp. CF4.18]|uniref:hypothetical protein n=1 Tax=Salipaludibacillus sp. CF4.18 TaxID=3373081 RepID=UPI003EE69166
MIIFIYSSLVAMYIVTRFFDNPLLLAITGSIAIIALSISFVHAKGLYLISGLIFSLIGLVLFIQNDLLWFQLLFQFESMLGVLSLFLFLPFINSLIRVGKYDLNLSLFLKQGVARLNKLYTRSFIVCHLLGLFLNIATIPLLAKSLKNSLDPLPRTVTDKFYSQNLLRAYALCLTWSPMEMMVSTSLDITQTNYLQVFPIMITIVFIAIMSDWILSYFKFKEPLIASQRNEHISINKRVYKKIVELIILLLFLIFSVSFLQQILDKGFLLSIVILIVPISIFWAFVIRRPKRYFSLAIPHWKQRTKGLSNYFFMFLSAGLFVQMLSISGYLAFLQAIFISTSTNTLLFFLLIGAFFLLSAFIGFHPLVSITLIAELLNPILSEISSVPLTIVLISSSLSTVMFSPYNLSVAILADHLKINSYKLGLYNLPFSIYYILLGIFTAFAIDLILY